MLIIAGREVRSIVGSSTFLPRQCAYNDGFRDIEKGLEFEGLYEISIENLSLILHRNSRGAMGQCRERRDRCRHGIVSPNEAEMEAHQLAELFSNLPGSDCSILAQ